MNIYEKKIPILVGNEERFEQVASNLQKRSEKIGLSLRYEIKVDELYTDDKGRQWIPTRIVYQLPSMGDYRLIATLEIYDNKNLIEVLDARYKGLISENVREITPYCHHCKQNRKRRYLYLIYDKKHKRLLQLGKSCSQSYIGKGNTERLYKYAEEIGQIERTLNKRPQYRYVYYPTEEYTRLVISKFVGNYQNKEYATSEYINDEYVNEQIKLYMKNKLDDNSIQQMISNEVSSIYREVLDYINSKQYEISSPEYNAKTLLSKRYLRADKTWNVYNYIINFIDNNARGFDYNEKYNILNTVNTAFSYLTQDNITFSYQGEDSSYIQVITNMSTDGLTDSVGVVRDEWIDNIVRKKGNQFEGIIFNLLKNPEKDISVKELKLIVNNIGFFLMNYEESEGSFYATIGDRVNINVKLKGIKNFEREAYMGGIETVYVYLFELLDDNVDFIWYTTKRKDELNIKDEGNVTMSARIKDHKQYKNKKQTIINYAKVIG